MRPMCVLADEPGSCSRLTFAAQKAAAVRNRPNEEQQTQEVCKRPGGVPT